MYEKRTVKQKGERKGRKQNEWDIKSLVFLFMWSWGIHLKETWNLQLQQIVSNYLNSFFKHTTQHEIMIIIMIL